MLKVLDNYGLTEVSGNRKTGKIAVSRSNSATCPKSCGMYYDCYGKFSHTHGHWKNTDQGKGENNREWADFLKYVKKYTSGTMFRHNEVGDLPGLGDVVDGERLQQLAKACSKASHAFTYTHKPVLSGSYTVTGNAKQSHTVDIDEKTAANNREAIERANASGLVVNLSADNLEQADQKSDLGIAPVVCVLPLDAAQGERYTTPAGRKVVTCPASLEANASREITCKTCKLCAVPNRRSIVGFPAHGAAKKRASKKVGA